MTAKRNNKYSTEFKQMVLDDLAKTGWTMTKIGEKHNVPHRNISNWKGARRQAHKFFDKDWAIVDPRLGKESDESISKSAPMSATTLYNRRVFLGIPAFKPVPSVIGSTRSSAVIDRNTLEAQELFMTWHLPPNLGEHLKEVRLRKLEDRIFCPKTAQKYRAERCA